VNAAEGWDDAWAAALAALELDVTEAEQMLAVDHIFEATVKDPWAPPVGLGPLPAALADRARTLLARQLEVSQRLASAARDSRRHGQAVQRMRLQPPSPPVYLDTPA